MQQMSFNNELQLWCCRVFIPYHLLPPCGSKYICLIPVITNFRFHCNFTKTFFYIIDCIGVGIGLFTIPTYELLWKWWNAWLLGMFEMKILETHWSWCLCRDNIPRSSYKKLSTGKSHLHQNRKETIRRKSQYNYLYHMSWVAAKFMVIISNHD